MKINIAIITTEFLCNYLNKIILATKSDYNVKIICFSDFSQIDDIFSKYHDEFDGFLFGGLSSMSYIKNKFENNIKPLACLMPTEVDYYKLILNLMNNNRDLDLNRIYIDYDSNLKSYILNNSLIDYLNNGFEIIKSSNLSELKELENFIAKEHIRLWNENKVDYCITRFSTIAAKLEENNINYHYVYPDSNHVLESLDNLASEIKLKQLINSQPISINITINISKGNALFDTHDMSSKLLALQSSINEFNKSNIYNFIIQRNYIGFEIYSDLKTLVSITDNLTNCALYKHFKNTLEFDVCIGYGIGTDINQAKLNAITANRESLLNHEHKSYIVNEKEDIIGPLSSDELLTISNFNDSYINNIAKTAKLSTLTVQKIIAAMKHNSSNEITANVLASILSITPRSANRFLSNLTACNLATISYEKQRSTKGRPEKTYKIHIEF